MRLFLHSFMIAGAIVWAGAAVSKAAEPIVILNTKNLCSISVNSVKITKATLISFRSTMEEFLEEKVIVYVHSCEYLLVGTENQTEVQYIMEHAVQLAPENITIPDATILMRIEDPVEFLQIASSANLNPPPPGGPSLPIIQEPQPEKSDNKCKVEEMCISRDGHASMKLKCGPIILSASTTGVFNVGVSGSAGEASVRFGAHDEVSK